MHIEFEDDALLELYIKGTTKDKKYKKLCRNKQLINGYARVVKTMYNVDSTEQLKNYSYLHYEKLRYQSNEPRSSVRLVNGKIERLIFTETDNGIKVNLIEIDNTHYGNK